MNLKLAEGIGAGRICVWGCTCAGDVVVVMVVLRKRMRVPGLQGANQEDPE